MATYKNPWHPDYGPSMYETDAKPIHYRGYLIYHRINSVSSGGNVWDVVMDGTCVTQRAGQDGAKRAIDNLMNHVDQDQGQRST